MADGAGSLMLLGPLGLKEPQQPHWPASHPQPPAITFNSLPFLYCPPSASLSSLSVSSPTSPYHPTPYPFILQMSPLLLPSRAAEFFQRKLYQSLLGPRLYVLQRWLDPGATLTIPFCFSMSLHTFPPLHSGFYKCSPLFKQIHHHMPSCLLTILYTTEGLQFDREHPGGPLLPVNSLGSPSPSSLWPRLFPVPLDLDPVFPIHPGFWLHHLFLLLPVSLNSRWLLYCSLSCNPSLPIKARKHSKPFCDLVYPPRNLFLSLSLVQSGNLYL